MDQAIRVLVVDDHDAVRAAVSEVLHEATDISVVGQAAGGEDALVLAAALGPDVVLLDVTMPAMSGFQAARALTDRHPHLRVLMFSAEDRREVVENARQAGAAGFLVKGCRGPALIRAIRRVSAGQPVWPART